MTTETAPVDTAPVESAEAPAEAAPEAPSQTETKAQEPKSEPKKYTIKVNGKERVVDERTVLAMIQKEFSADEKFQQTAAERRRIEQLTKLSKEDPERLLKELAGLDPDEWAKDRIRKQIERLSMTEEQRELADAKARIAAYEKEKADREAQSKAESEKRATEFFIKQYDTEIPTELKKVGLPVNEDTVRYTAEVMLANLEEGLDLPYEMVMDVVKDKYHNGIKKYFSSADTEALIELLGDQVDKLYETKKSKGKKQAPRQAVQDNAPEKKSGTTFNNKEEFEAYIRSWASGG